MVEIIECADMMGQSKNDFLRKGIPITDSDGNQYSLPRAKMWVEFESPAALMRVAELLGVKAINKRGKDYVFALKGMIYYAKD
ncbi:hypothetical protein GF325_00955 [Candidatus Bathyarchaeota archaeon]|nr:hypothetical protein [Candidatus Bathyarchaeota archaeon]